MKKSFTSLREVPNKSLSHTLDDYRIAAALINRFFQRLFSDVDNSGLIVSSINEGLNSNNELQKIVEDKQLVRIKTKFIKLVDSLIADLKSQKKT